MKSRLHLINQERLTEIALFLVLLICYTYTPPRWADWNQNSRFDLVVAIVDHGTLSIDCCVANTGDYALFEGHTYSDKAPGLALLGVPTYWLFDRIAAIGPAQSIISRLAHSNTLGRNGRELAQAKYDYRVACRALDDIYRCASQESSKHTP